jgi:hypothetical protein
VGFCEHGNEPSVSIKEVGYCLESCVTISFSKYIQHHGVSKYQFSVMFKSNFIISLKPPIAQKMFTWYKIYISVGPAIFVSNVLRRS